jgi:hypothetical protein
VGLLSGNIVRPEIIRIKSFHGTPKTSLRKRSFTRFFLKSVHRRAGTAVAQRIYHDQVHAGVAYFSYDEVLVQGLMCLYLVNRVLCVDNVRSCSVPLGLSCRKASAGPGVCNCSQYFPLSLALSISPKSSTVHSIVEYSLAVGCSAEFAPHSGTQCPCQRSGTSV